MLHVGPAEEMCRSPNGRLTLGSRVLLHRAERYGLRAVVQRWCGKVASGGAHVDLAADASGKDLPEEERDLRLRRHLERVAPRQA